MKEITKIGSIYIGLDPFRTSMKLVPISLVFTRDLVEPVRIGSAIWYHIGLLMKVILMRNRTVQV